MTSREKRRIRNPDRGVYSMRLTANAKSTWEQLLTQLQSPLAASGRRIKDDPTPAGRTGRNREGNAPRTTVRRA